MHQLLHARTIAIVGISDEGFSARIYRNLEKNRFRGDIHFINPRRSSLWGRQCFPDLSHLPTPVDLAIIVVPSLHALPCLDMCIDHGVGFALVNTSGMPADGLRDLHFRALSKGMRILGPNILGAILPDVGNGPIHAIPLEMRVTGRFSNTAVVTQSGGLGALISGTLARREIGSRYFLHTGNELDISVVECIEALAQDPEVAVICLVLEQVRDIRRFGEAALKARRAGKRLVSLKLGRSAVGATATLSHTGALAGDTALYDKLFSQWGILVCKTSEDLVEVVQLASLGYRHRGPNVAMISASGGVCAHLADVAAETGVDLAVLAESTSSSLMELQPIKVGIGSNPLDLPVTDAAVIEQALNLVGADPSVGCVIYFTALLGNHAAQLQPVAERFSVNHGKFLYLVGEGGDFCGDFSSVGVHSATHAARAMRNISLMNQWSELDQSSFDAPWSSASLDSGSYTLVAHDLLGHTARAVKNLTEFEGKHLLELAGFKVPAGRIAASPEGAQDLAEVLGYPVAVKISSRHIQHKSKSGGVKLDLANGMQVRAAALAISQIDSEQSGILIEKMIAPGLEFLLGARVDDTFGPIVVVANGGLKVESAADYAVRLAPVSPLVARAMLCELATVLPENIELLCDLIVRMSVIIAQHHMVLSEIEVNPLIVDWSGLDATVADALVICRLPEMMK